MDGVPKEYFYLPNELMAQFRPCARDGRLAQNQHPITQANGRGRPAPRPRPATSPPPPPPMRWTI
ncbi:MAG: hypothetical protein IPL28_07140 [Chloroflexi bacterium]|nr:hypothetical protein [Chloroflexota bacterium]